MLLSGRGERSVSGGRRAQPEESAYERFYHAVAVVQLADWLPSAPCRVLDLSRPTFAGQLAHAGHQVVYVTSPDGNGNSDHGDGDGHHGGTGPTGRALPLVADVRRLLWMADESVDAVLAECRVLSSCLSAETTLADIARVLRPEGRLLLCVDSLVTGLAQLAEQGRWAELSDAPGADVVLVPRRDGSVSRCFWPEELHSAIEDVGLHVEWVRPRTVLPPEAIERALKADPTALSTLVRTEVALAAERAGESIGIHLLASARRAG